MLDALAPFTVLALPIAAVAALLSVIAIVMLMIEHRRLSRLMLGRSGASLEESIVTLARRMKEIEQFRSELEQYLKQAEVRIATSIRGISTVRFNPFKGDGSGGNQSFAVALVNEEGSGVVLSTIYSRERVSVFGKPIAKGASTFELSDEEREAVKQAKEQAVK
jgi:hypothetical protein